MKSTDITLKDIKNELYDKMYECSSEYFTFKSLQNNLGIDIWTYKDANVKLNFDECFNYKSIEKLYIYARNDIKISFENVMHITFNKLIIEAPGIVLDTGKQFNVVSIFTTGSKIKLPDNVANEVQIEKIINVDEEEVRNSMSSFAIIPGCGEFVLDINESRNKKATSSVEELKRIFPNIKWVSVIVSWFGTDLDIKNCKIKPGYDRNCTKLNDWKVGDWKIKGLNSQQSALEISLEQAGVSRYGGTTNDTSVLSYINLLKQHDIKVAFYPFFMMDIDGKPWRGHLSGHYEDVECFTKNEYIPFIMHYAKLVKGSVDAFIIGSELVSLTNIKSSEDQYPFIDSLVELATLCKVLLGDSVLITYAANWSEYHTVDGINRPLDKLWAHEAIDVVGIDAYFPLTDSQNIRMTRKEISKKWTSGEGWDYYMENKQKVCLSPSEPWNQWKNIKYWWESEHWVGSNKTDWRPKMKPIWLTEYGFASIDKSPNEPNIFYDRFSTVDGGIPKHSKGKVDFAIQRESILATLDFVNENAFIENAFYWCWDARSPGWQCDNYYSDSHNWKFGHWIDGKIFNQQPIYVEPTIQKNLIIRSFTDIDVIPSVKISGVLHLKTDGYVKVRDDLILYNYYSKSLNLKKIDWFNLYLNDKAMYLKKFGGKSFIEANNPQIQAKKGFIIATKNGGVYEGNADVINNQFYSKDFIYNLEEEIKIVGDV